SRVRAPARGRRETSAWASPGSAESERGRRGGHVERDRDGRRGPGDGPLRVLQTVAGDRTNDEATGAESAGGVRLQKAGDTRRARGLDEHPFLAREKPVRLENLLVSNGLDGATGLVARRERLLPRRGVADA